MIAIRSFLPSLRGTLVLVVAALLFSSCREVSFKEPQPAGVEPLKTIPPELQGRYQAIGSEADRDTLIIESWGYHFKDAKDHDWLGKGTLSDSLVVKSYGDYYFVNFRAGNQWVLRVIRRKTNGSIDFLSINIQDDAHRKEMLRKIGKRLKVTEIELNGDTFYQITPTRDQLMALIRDGFFTGNELIKLR